MFLQFELIYSVDVWLERFVKSQYTKTNYNSLISMHSPGTTNKFNQAKCQSWYSQVISIEHVASLPGVGLHKTLVPCRSPSRVALCTKVSVEVVEPLVAVKMASLMDEHGWLGLLHVTTGVSAPALETDTQSTPTFCPMSSQVVCCPDRFSVSSTAPLGLLHAGRLTPGILYRHQWKQLNSNKLSRFNYTAYFKRGGRGYKNTTYIIL